MTDEVIRVDEEAGPDGPPGEDGLELPLERIPAELLERMLAEYVTREWADGDGTVADRAARVRRQLQQGRARVVYDIRTETWNIVERR